MRRFLCLATLSLAAAAADTFAAETAQLPASCNLPQHQHLQASAAGGSEGGSAGGIIASSS